MFLKKEIGASFFFYITPKRLNKVYIIIIITLIILFWVVETEHVILPQDDAGACLEHHWFHNLLSVDVTHSLGSRVEHYSALLVLQGHKEMGKRLNEV